MPFGKLYLREIFEESLWDRQRRLYVPSAFILDEPGSG